MRPFLADLHVHSVLSPCADDMMLPTMVIAAALRRGLAIIALTDHNSAENTGAFVAAAQGTDLHVLPGVEVTTREEVHVLTLFDDVSAALAWQDTVYQHLPPLPNDEHAFGTQLVISARDEIISVNERLLLTATDLSLAQVVDSVTQAGGLAIPAHVDRAAFGLISQLGFMPPDLDLPVVEISRFADPAEPTAVHPSLGGRCVITSSDAHFLEDVGIVRTVFWLEKPSIAELRLAISGRDGRRVANRRG